MEQKNMDTYFINLVLMLSSACWQQLGKVPNPMSGKTEIDLAHAQVTIEMLEMIKQKTINNLTKEEDQLLSNSIADLKINYADEVNKKSQSQSQA